MSEQAAGHRLLRLLGNHHAKHERHTQDDGAEQHIAPAAPPDEGGAATPADVAERRAEAGGAPQRAPELPEAVDGPAERGGDEEPATGGERGECGEADEGQGGELDQHSDGSEGSKMPRGRGGAGKGESRPDTGRRGGGGSGDVGA
jgi:hypothetical protein